MSRSNCDNLPGKCCGNMITNVGISLLIRIKHDSKTKRKKKKKLPFINFIPTPFISRLHNLNKSAVDSEGKQNPNKQSLVSSYMECLFDFVSPSLLSCIYI